MNYLFSTIIPVIVGVLTFIVGQVVVKFLIEPSAELKKFLGKVTYDLIFYANWYSGSENVPEEIEKEVSKVLRSDASKLHEYVNTIPKYDWIAPILRLPKREAMMSSAGELIGLSNSINGRMKGQWVYKAISVRNIAKNLGISVPQGLSDKEMSQALQTAQEL
jgi:hypothetical protein